MPSVLAERNVFFPFFVEVPYGTCCWRPDTWPPGATLCKNSRRAPASGSPALSRALCAHPRRAPPPPTHHDGLALRLAFHYPYYNFTVQYSVNLQFLFANVKKQLYCNKRP